MLGQLLQLKPETLAELEIESVYDQMVTVHTDVSKVAQVCAPAGVIWAFVSDVIKCTKAMKDHSTLHNTVRQERDNHTRSHLTYQEAQAELKVMQKAAGACLIEHRNADTELEREMAWKDRDFRKAQLDEAVSTKATLKDKAEKAKEELLASGSQSQVRHG